MLTPVETPGGRLLRHTIVDHFSAMSLRDKVFLALRYIDELSRAEMGDVLGSNGEGAMNWTRAAAGRLREAARNEVLEYPEHDDEPVAQQKPWTPPETLATFLRARHRMDVNEYVGIFTIALREDVSYLAAILSEEQNVLHDGRHGNSKTSPFQQVQIDIMLGQGMTQRDIADRLGVSQPSISYHVRTRRAITSALHNDGAWAATG